MVAMGLDIFAHPVGGAVVTASGLHTVAGAAIGKGAVEAQQGVGGGGLVLGQLDNLVARHGQTLKQRVREGFRELGLRGRAGGLAQGAQVNVVGVCQTQQQLGRHGTLIALDMVEIGGRDPEVAGHGGLGQGQIPPEPLEAPSEKQLAICTGVHFRRRSQNDLTKQVTS
jgi:hypothetical protein